MGKIYDMKLFDLDAKPKSEVKQKKQQEQEYKYIGSIRHNRGHILYAINKKTLEVHEAEYISKKTLTWKEALKIYLGGHVKREVQVERDCFYIEAMNKENALKKYKKLFYKKR